MSHPREELTNLSPLNRVFLRLMKIDLTGEVLTMNPDNIDICPSLGMCITLPKSIASLNRAVQWVKEEVLNYKYYAYYDLNSYNRHKIGIYNSLSKAVQARNSYEIGLIESRGVKGILMELAKYMRAKLPLTIGESQLGVL